MIIHLLDGTYELFRHFYGIRRFKKTDPPLGAVSGVLATVAQLLEDGATHVGVATDHIIESFRNKLWTGYKTGAGVEPALKAQFTPLEEALGAMGVVVWPEVELEADDALASAAYLAAQDERVVQVDRRGNAIRGADAVRAKFGVAPQFIPDYLALVGDSADGYPGIPGFGPKTATTLINRYGPLEEFGPEVLNEQNRALALLFKDLATLRTDAPLFENIDELEWRGATPEFAAVAEQIGSARLLARVRKLEKRFKSQKGTKSTK
jgi:5'-3' exonuclease